MPYPIYVARDSRGIGANARCDCVINLKIPDSMILIDLKKIYFRYYSILDGVDSQKVQFVRNNTDLEEVRVHSFYSVNSHQSAEAKGKCR